MATSSDIFLQEWRVTKGSRSRRPSVSPAYPPRPEQKKRRRQLILLPRASSSLRWR